jgi:hypothetical protein
VKRLVVVAALAIIGTAFLQVQHAPAVRADASGRGGDFVPIAPESNLVDTRNGNGGIGSNPVGANSTHAISVLGHAGIPASGVSAILVDIEAANPSATTWLILWPDGSPFPATTTLNAKAGEFISNSAVVQVAANGKIDLYNKAGTTDVVIDVQGYFTQTSSGTTGRGGFVPVPDTRIVDTRSGLGAPKATIASQGSLTVTVTTGPVPTTANAVFINLLIPGASQHGFISAYPVGVTTTVSILNFEAGSTNTGGGIKVGTNGRITLVNHSPAAINMVLDLQGYFTASSATGAGLRPANAVLIDTRSTGT